MRMLSALAAVLLLGGCEGQVAGEPTVPGRWYTPAQVESGKFVFQANCAVCHGKSAQGTVLNWRKTQADGSYPPPPLNGTAHAWHHPLSVLLRTIGDGGMQNGGKMPGFGQKLSVDEQRAAIAFFQSHWGEKIYQGWLSRGGVDK